MIWSEGFTASYYITIVDPKSWRDTGRMEITAGTITRSADGLMESADLSMTEIPGNGETWIRIWLDADQDGITHVPLFTGLASVPSRSVNGFQNTYQVECYSVLKPMSDILTERGYYVPAEVPAPDAVERLLRTGFAPVQVAVVGDPPRLTDAIIAEDGESNLTLAQKVLDAIDWRMRIDGMGTIYIEPNKPETVAIFDATQNDVIEMTLTDKYDWYSCPNIVRATSGDLTAIAIDDRAESPLSTVSRGREIWHDENSVSLGDNESIAAYAIRKLKELQSPARTVTYSRRFDPAVGVGDQIRINHPEIGIDGLFKVTSQSFELIYGCRTSEEATSV